MCCRECVPATVAACPDKDCQRPTTVHDSPVVARLIANWDVCCPTCKWTGKQAQAMRHASMCGRPRRPTIVTMS
jgi:hypothetical protein